MANSNNSQSPLTNLMLNGTNYIQWARAVKVGLGGRSKLEHITGLVEKPDGTTTTVIDKNKDWIATDLCVMSWIFNTMEPKIYGIFAFSNTAKELWDSLFEMYGNSNNSSRVFEIQQNISSLKQGHDQTFLEHLGTFKQQWEELRQYRPVMATVQEYIKREEQDQIFYLLAGLSSEFEEVRRDILMRPELPSINTICSIIQSEETRKRVMGKCLKVNNPSLNSENYAHLTSFKSDDHSKWKGKEKKGSKYYCDHCNRNEHTRDRCFILHPHLKGARNRAHEINLAVQPQNSETGNVQEKLEQLSKQMEFLMKRCTAAPDSLPTGPKGETTNLV